MLVRGFVICLLIASAPSRAEYWGSVERVLDAETLEVRTERGVLLRLSLAMIDAPELDQPFGELVPLVIASLTRDQRVRVTHEEIGRYGTMARIYYNDGRDGLSSVLVYGGLAWCRDQEDIECMVYQNTAKASGFGVWINPKPIHPRDWRAGER